MVVVVEIAFYAIAHLLGIVVGSRLFTGIAEETIQAPEPVSISNLLFVFLIATLIFFVILKTKKRAGGMAIKGLFFLGLFVGIQTALSVFIGDIPAAFIAIVLLIVQSRTNTVLGHNLLFLAAAGGIGGVLGVSIPLKEAAILLAILSVYDVVAVYVTRHMVVMAEGMLKTGAMFGIILPRKKELWMQSIRPIAREKLESMREKDSSSKRGKGAFFLGGGDIALPMILVVAALQKGLQASFIVLGFTLVGFVLMQTLFSRLGHERPMPALPPLAGMALLSLLVI